MATGKTEKQIYINAPIKLHSRLVLLGKASRPPKTLKAVVLEALEEKVKPLSEIKNLDEILRAIGELSR